MLRKIGAGQIIALLPEGTLSFRRSVQGELGIEADEIEPIVSSLRVADHASIRGVGEAIGEDQPKDATPGKP